MQEAVDRLSRQSVERQCLDPSTPWFTLLQNATPDLVQACPGSRLRSKERLELSCPAALATAHSFPRILAGKPPSTFRMPAGSAAASCWAAFPMCTL